MSQNYLFLMEFLIFDGAAVAWGLWELRSLRRDAESSRRDADAAEAARSEDLPGHSER